MAQRIATGTWFLKQVEQVASQAFLCLTGVKAEGQRTPLLVLVALYNVPQLFPNVFAKTSPSLQVQTNILVLGDSFCTLKVPTTKETANANLPT